MDSSLKILVVDDEPDILATLAYSLSLRGHQVTTAADGLEALELAKRVPPEVVILDVMLPGCNGYEVSRLLKEWMDNDPSAPSFPILLLTARKVDSQEREKFIATWSRADACVYKPFEMDELLLTISELTGNTSLAPGGDRESTLPS